LILYALSSKTLTTSFENSRLVVKSTADYLIPGLLFGGIIVGVLTAVATSIIVILMTHRVAGPMYRFQKQVEKVGSGELASDLSIRKKDQFQDFVTAFNKMTDDLNSGVLKVVDVSDKLGDLIEKLSGSSSNELLLKEDIKKVISELKKDKKDLKKALGHFKIKR